VRIKKAATTNGHQSASSLDHASAPTYNGESDHRTGEGAPRPQNPRAGCHDPSFPLTKTQIARKLRSLEPKIEEFVRRDSDAGEIERDDLINTLEILLRHALDLIPDEDEAVIRWKPEDIREAAADMDLRLSRRQARDILRRIRRGLEDTSLGAGQEVINDCLEDLEERLHAAMKASGRKSAKAQSA
jgi:hypothetical protein